MSDVSPKDDITHANLFDVKGYEMYGMLEPSQISTIASRISGKTVWALGSGHTDEEALQLAAFGAAKIYAVDKARRNMTAKPYFSTSSTGIAEIVECHAYFDEFLLWSQKAGLAPDVVFLKWPREMHMPGLIELLMLSPEILYVGLNDGCTACGSPELWRYLKTRKLLSVVEGQQNDLLVYGVYGDLDEPALEPRCREEKCAIESW